MVEKFLGHDESHAIRGATVARMVAVIHQVVAIVEAQFLAGRNVAPGDDPDMVAVLFRLTIGRATVIDESCRIPWHVAVQVHLFVERKNVRVARDATFERLVFGNPLTDVLDDARALRDGLPRESARAMNPRVADFQPFIPGRGINCVGFFRC